MTAVLPVREAGLPGSEVLLSGLKVAASATEVSA